MPTQLLQTPASGEVPLQHQKQTTPKSDAIVLQQALQKVREQSFHSLLRLPPTLTAETKVCCQPTSFPESRQHRPHPARDQPHPMDRSHPPARAPQKHPAPQAQPSRGSKQKQQPSLNLPKLRYQYKSGLSYPIATQTTTKQAKQAGSGSYPFRCKKTSMLRRMLPLYAAQQAKHHNVRSPCLCISSRAASSCSWLFPDLAARTQACHE